MQTTTNTNALIAVSFIIFTTAYSVPFKWQHTKWLHIAWLNFRRVKDCLCATDIFLLTPIYMSVYFNAVLFLIASGFVILVSFTVIEIMCRSWGQLCMYYWNRVAAGGREAKTWRRIWLTNVVPIHEFVYFVDCIIWSNPNTRRKMYYKNSNSFFENIVKSKYLGCSFLFCELILYTTAPDEPSLWRIVDKHARLVLYCGFRTETWRRQQGCRLQQIHGIATKENTRISLSLQIRE